MWWWLLLGSDPLINELEHSKKICGLNFEFRAVVVNSFNFFNLLHLSFILKSMSAIATLPFSFGIYHYSSLFNNGAHPNGAHPTVPHPNGLPLVTPGDPWWPLVTPSDSFLKMMQMKKNRGKMKTNKGKSLFSKNWNGILRSAINEWRPKN